MFTKIIDLIDRNIAAKFGEIASYLAWHGIIKKYGFIYRSLWSIDNYFNDLNTKI